MKASEFYEKYIRVKLPSGLVHPRPLTEFEKLFLDNATSKENVKIVYMSGPRRRNITIDIEKLKKMMDEKDIQDKA